MEAKAMTVAKLRAELKKRGATTGGLKSELVSRLKQVREEQSGDEAADPKKESGGDKKTTEEPTEKPSGRLKRGSTAQSKLDAAEAEATKKAAGKKTKKQTAAQAKKEAAAAKVAKEVPKAEKEAEEKANKQASTQAKRKTSATLPPKKRAKAEHNTAALATKPVMTKPIIKNAEHGLATHSRMYAGGGRHCIRADERSGQVDVQWAKSHAKTLRVRQLEKHEQQEDAEATKQVMKNIMHQADENVVSVATSKGVAHLPMRASKNPTEHAKPRPCPVSGRWWKTQNAHRSSNSNRDGKIATGQKMLSWAEKQAKKEKFKKMKDLERDLLDAKKRRIQASKDEKEDLKKRKMENEMKAVVYQTINKTHKLKTMNKKQLRQIKKTRMNKNGVVELVGAYEK
jgi:hypothetical protein